MRKFIPILLSAILILSSITFCFADPFENHSLYSDQLIQKVSLLIDSIFPEINDYGIDANDSSTFFLGSPIPVYKLINGSLVSEQSTVYIPLIVDDIWMATIITYADDHNEPVIQLAKYYSDEYYDLDLQEEQIALVFSDNDVLFYSDETGLHTHIKEQAYIINSRVETISITPNVSLNLQKSSLSNLRFSNQKYLSVPQIQMTSGSMQCWAACIASVRGYYGTYTTIDDVYNFTGITKYNGQTIIECSDHLDDYNLSYIEYFYMNSFNWYVLRTEIDSFDSPIMASCTYGYNSNNQPIGHMVLIRGYYSYTNVPQLGIISYMDPATGYYGASTVGSNTDFNYAPNTGAGPFEMELFTSVRGQ